MTRLLFGVRRHGGDCWAGHPMVRRAEEHFDSDDEWGWVELDLHAEPAITPPAVQATVVEASATRDADLYFWGEDGCPLDLLQRMPNAKTLLVSLDGPSEGDSRDCWTAGIVLNR